ncbi:hypothetical protein [Paraburkholderia sp. BL10I2N1]|uniref:hypothetical protein n=1 Tax=Paraburkholderia sp. BL10I2N1 TaxID=1938796 RepID=UPI0010EF16FC|nr:hypothetical protein [Paraburkholderia sp. BL10I2N1]TDN70818.1 hypothetical protein B0G77_4324 [Paraburkholderia sp. BL10I2N1]
MCIDVTVHADKGFSSAASLDVMGGKLKKLLLVSLAYDPDELKKVPAQKCGRTEASCLIDLQHARREHLDVGKIGVFQKKSMCS